MTITPGTLCFALAIILNSIELGSQVTLKELFPGYKRGEIPPIRTFKYKPNSQLLQLRRKDGDRLDEFPINSILIARAHVIIGWKKHDNIRQISDLSGKNNQVFDIYKDQFVSLSPNEIWKLGVDRRYSLSRKDDIAAAKRKLVPKANPQEIHLSSNQAIQQANLHTVNQTHYQGNLRADPQTIPQSYHEELSQASPQEIHPTHYQASHQASDQVIHPTHNEAIQQAYYKMYEQALKGHMR